MPTRAKPTPTHELSWSQVVSWRMARHHLDRPAGGEVVDVARRICGLHAQVASSAEQSAWIRTATVTPDRLRRAVEEDRSLVKVWAARGTLHLMPSQDWPLWTAAFSTRRNHKTGSWLTYHGVTAEDMSALFDVVPAALDGRCLTREELVAEVVKRTGRAGLGEALTSGWGAVLKPLALRGLLCFGPERGRNVTFVLPRDWLPEWTDVPVDVALPEVMRRYLGAFGPSTFAEFHRWSAIDLPVCRRLFDDHAAELTPVSVEGDDRVAMAADADEIAAQGPPETRLLPAFDPLTIGLLRHLDRLLPADRAKDVSRAAGWISPILLAGGRIAGTWTVERTRAAAAVTITPFAPLSKPTRVAAEAHAATYETAFGVPVTVGWA